MNKVKDYIVFVLFLLNTLTVMSVEHHRNRRFLIFPKTEPTRIQILAGIGIPISGLDLESVTIGYIFKGQFFLPDNASHFLNPLNDPFDLTTQRITGIHRKRRSLASSTSSESIESPESKIGDYHGFDDEQNENVERHQVDAEVIESGTESPSDTDETIDDELWIDQNHSDDNDLRSSNIAQYLGTTRFSLYKGMAAVAERKGFSGKACVLRSICEAAHTQFDYSNGVLGEMMHVIMTPSATRDEISEYADYEYYRAERLGKEGAPCERVFKECKISILDQFSGVYSTSMDLLNYFVN